jgi:predicted 3-demethylubiquinone-9 3-methyltransferase (glyoxalase superfamily)
MQKITPFVWFEKGAKEAADYYVSVFGGDSKITSENIMPNTPSGTVEIINATLAGETFTFMAAGPFRQINEAISFVVPCDSQEEIDRLWGQLSAVPEAEQCGWCKDKFGLSWQIIPADMSSLVGGSDADAAGRATQAMLGMKKIDIQGLKDARNAA